MALNTVEADYLVDTAFTSAFAWDRRANGNYVRRWRRLLLTVFQRSGWWYWSINAGRGKVAFSTRAYRTVGQAMEAVAREAIGV